MRTKIVRTDRTDQPIYLGYQGENNALQIKFNVSGWADTYGVGVFSLTAQRPGETATYNVEVTADSTYAVWTVSGYDTENYGSGYAQLSYTVGQTVAKSVLYATLINQALAPGAAPAPGENEVVMVTLTNDGTITSDTSVGEILDAMSAGKWVFAIYNGSAIGVASMYGDSAVAFRVQIDLDEIVVDHERFIIGTATDSGDSWGEGQQSFLATPAFKVTFASNWTTTLEPGAIKELYNGKTVQILVDDVLAMATVSYSSGTGRVTVNIHGPFLYWTGSAYYVYRQLSIWADEDDVGTNWTEETVHVAQVVTQAI